MTAAAAPIARAGGPPRKPAPSEERVGEALGHDDQREHSGRALGDELRQFARPEKSTRSTGRSAAARNATAIAPTSAPETTRARTGLGFERDAIAWPRWRIPDDDGGDADRNDDAPREIGNANRLVRRNARERQLRLVDPRPVLDAREDECAGPGSDEAGQQRAPEPRERICRSPRRPRRAGRRRRRALRTAPRSRRTPRPALAELGFGSLIANEPHGEGPDAEADRDQRRPGSSTMLRLSGRASAAVRMLTRRSGATGSIPSPASGLCRRDRAVGSPPRRGCPREQ